MRRALLGGGVRTCGWQLVGGMLVCACACACGWQLVGGMLVCAGMWLAVSWRHAGVCWWPVSPNILIIIIPWGERSCVGVRTRVHAHAWCALV